MLLTMDEENIIRKCVRQGSTYNAGQNVLHYCVGFGCATIAIKKESIQKFTLPALNP